MISSILQPVLSKKMLPFFAAAAMLCTALSTHAAGLPTHAAGLPTHAELGKALKEVVKEKTADSA